MLLKLKELQWTTISVVFFILSTSLMVAFAESAPIMRVTKAQGDYISIKGQCTATLSISKIGGYLNLSIKNNLNKKKSNSVHDITGMTWLTDNTLLYTVSPIYGKPGVYKFYCSMMQHMRILGPQTINKAYPDGADYFELMGYTKDTIETALFYYALDVDLVNFSEFRTKNSLYEVSLDGNGFRKVESAK